MSTRTSFRPYKILNAASMGADITSSPTILQSLTKVAYAVSWTGTSPVGTISIQGSNDYALNPDGTVQNAGTWTALVFSVNGSPTSTFTVSGNTGTGIADITVTAVYATRLIYTHGSGTGSLTATINGKVS